MKTHIQTQEEICYIDQEMVVYVRTTIVQDSKANQITNTRVSNPELDMTPLTSRDNANNSNINSSSMSITLFLFNSINHSTDPSGTISVINSNTSIVSKASNILMDVIYLITLEVILRRIMRN